MNVYIDRSLRALLKRFPQVSVEVFTVATGASGRGVRPMEELVGRRAVVHFIDVGREQLTKEELPGLVPLFARGVREAMLRRPDVVHAHYWLSGVVALEYAPDVPLVQTMHTTAAAKNARASAGEALEPQVRLAGEQRIVDSGAFLVVNTALEAGQMCDFYGAADNRLAVVSPGVEASIYRPLEGVGPSNAGSATRLEVLFAGRPQPLKGPHLIVEALALLPADLRVSFTMVGESASSYEQEVLARAQELGLDVRLLPSLAPRLLADRMRRADVVVCPSSSETFGLVALEAQACGTPVLASDVDGLRSAVLDGVTGLLVSPRTPEAWALALEKLARDPELRQRLGRAGAARAAQLTWDQTAEKLLALYYRLAETAC